MFDAYSVSDVALNLRLEISSICCKKSAQSVFVGSKDGNLMVCAPPKQAHRGYELVKYCKKFERRAVMNMQICEEKKLILCVSDGLLSAHCLKDDQHPVISMLHKVKPVTAFCHWNDKDDGFMYIVTSSRKRLQLFRWADKDFAEINLECSLQITDTPLNLKLCSEKLLFSMRDEYHWGGFSQSVQDGQEVWTLSPKKITSAQGATPLTVDIADKKMIGLMVNDYLLVYPELGTQPCFPEVRFSDSPLSVVYDPPYITALLTKGRIEVRALNPCILVQNIVLAKAQFIRSGIQGQLYVASTANTSDIWVLDANPNLRKNVSTLVAEKHFDLAIQIADMSNIFTDENKVEIKRQAAANLFNQKKFEESFRLHAEIQTGWYVLKVIQLFPDLLPELGQQTPVTAASDLSANDKKRALLALGNYLSEVRTEHWKRLDMDRFSSDPMPKDDVQNLQRTLIIVDTTLLNCYLQTKPMLVDSLLRLQNNTCCFEDAEAILKKANRLPSLFVLYETRKKHELALDLLFTQSQDPDADGFFEGTDRIVEYLQTIGNTHLELIFHYAKWVLSKDTSEGLSIFISDDSDLAKTLDREKVLDFLRAHCLAVVIPYLEHLIYNWDDPNPVFHEALLEHYILKVKRLMSDYVQVFPDDQNFCRAGEEEGDLGMYRRSLLRFLQFSLQYNPQAILFQLNNHPLYEERALLMGRLKLHEQALTIYTSIINDFDLAEQYCKVYFDRTDSSNSQVYLQWLRAYLNPYEPQKAGLQETMLPIPPPDVPSAIKVLSRHADKIDTVAALGEFPDDTNLRVIARALIAVMQTVRDSATSLSLRSSICTSAMNHAQNRLRALECTRIFVNNSSECIKCGKKIGNSAFVRFPAEETLVHFYCHK